MNQATDSTVTFSKGQTVFWPPAPLKFAEVEDVMRTRVRLFYKHRTGRKAITADDG